MKLFVLLLFCIAVANATVIHKTTSKKSTDIYKRTDPIYEYTSLETITIFKEGDTAWNSNWIAESSPEETVNPKVIDGEIVITLKDNMSFSLSNPNLESNYGILSFEYKIEKFCKNDDCSKELYPAILNVCSYDGNNEIVIYSELKAEVSILQ